jgi:hypothetical protein
MAGSSIFVTYGLKSGGGPSFLRRTRTAFGQPETRTRSCVGTPQNYQLIQGGHRACHSQTPYAMCGSSCTPGSSASGCIVYYRSLGGHGTCPFQQPWGIFNTSCSPTSTSFAYGSFSGWSNTSSCTPASPTCNSNGVINRECRTIYSFREEDWSAYEEADVCNSQTPTAALNALQIECVPQ